MNKNCELCGSPIENGVNHHYDYEYNLTVYLCRRCHSRVHHDPSETFYPVIDNESRKMGEIARENQKKRDAEIARTEKREYIKLVEKIQEILGR